MKTLYILRHAKSSWDDPSLADFDRPLNHRGRLAAPFMGELIKRHAYQPDIILSSPAKRAKATAIAVKEASNAAATIDYEPAIYEASPHTLVQIIAGIDDKYNSAMLVGHNPGLEGLIGYLTGQIEPMPTAALALIRLEIANWAGVEGGLGTLKAIHRPKDDEKN